MNPISRRDFLKLSALAMGSLAFTPFLPEITDFEDADLVRVTIPSVSVYSQPSDESRIVAQWFRDEIVNVYEEVISNTPGYNPVWYRVWSGYMHRARLQKVKILYNQPLSVIPEPGQMLAEVTVPYTQALRYTTIYGWQPLYRLYYETVHWVVGIDEGPDKQPWYRVLDELLDNINYHVPAIHLRPIPPEELIPLSPDVPFEKKRIEVSLERQTLTAYEYDAPVLEAKISSGLAGLSLPDREPTITPVGRFNIMVKMPSKHMGDGNLAADIEAYELPGVPWNCFFTEKGHAFHGAYWHDNFGVPMSHGCVNMRMADAKWLFRWTLPVASYAEIHPLTLDRKGYGTRVVIY